jgi:RNA ligase
MSYQPDLRQLEKLIEQGYLIKQTHPQLDLTIYNYTAKTQYERFWNPDTLNCRGLIINESGVVVGRPLPKFFNLDENKSEIPKERPQVYEKLDGSLIILFYYGDRPQVASRGSFASEQAIKAKLLLETNPTYQKDLRKLDPNYTYIFEIIYPQNRIVVDYGNQERLVLLAIVHTETGAEIPCDSWWSDVAKIYDFPDLKTLREINLDNQEGFILHWSNGLRVKYKFAEYKRLHSILTNVSTKTIWESLKEGNSLDEIIDQVPDEFYHWVKLTENQLRSQYAEIEAQCQQVFKVLETRKETAVYFQSQTYPSILFSMLDDRDYSQIIWRMIQPPYSKPFKVIDQ